MNEKKYLIDTDVLIDYLRGASQAEQFLEKIISHSVCCLSVITVAELYAGVKSEKEQHIIDKMLQIFEIVDINEAIAPIGGFYRRDFSKSHGVGLADALIAATVEHHEAQLVTFNKKHFPMIKNIIVPYDRN